jgi:hypothetical protein
MPGPAEKTVNGKCADCLQQAQTLVSARRGMLLGVANCEVNAVVVDTQCAAPCLCCLVLQ